MQQNLDYGHEKNSFFKFFKDLEKSFSDNVFVLLK